MKNKTGEHFPKDAMAYAQNASSGFALRNYRTLLMIQVLAQRGPDKAAERLRTE
jgi:hypothetical protein